MALVNGSFLHYMDMKKFLKNLLLRNRWSEFEIISQECSLGDPFQNLFAKFWSVYKYGSGEWGLFALYRHEEIHVCIVQKNLVLRNHWSDFEIISQEYSLGDPFQKLFTKFWSVYKYGSGEWGLFALYRHEEIHVCIVQKNLVLRNHRSDFEIISRESGFDISRRPNCMIRAIIATGKLPWPFVSLLDK